MEDLFFDFYKPVLAEQKVKEVVFSALDFETTGLYPQNDRIIEIGLFQFTMKEKMKTLETFINPEIPIPLESSRISGINDSHVADAPVISLVLDSITQMLEGTVLVAHNLNFDYGFLKEAVAVHQKNYSMEVGIDTVALAKKVFPGRKSYSLQNLGQDLGLLKGNAHRALDDARLCGDLFILCLQNIPGVGEMTAKDLFLYSNTRLK